MKVFVCVCVCVCFLFAGVELIKLTQKEKEFQVYCSGKSIKQTRSEEDSYHFSFWWWCGVVIWIGSLFEGVVFCFFVFWLGCGKVIIINLRVSRQSGNLQYNQIQRKIWDGEKSCRGT